MKPYRKSFDICLVNSLTMDKTKVFFLVLSYGVLTCSGFALPFEGLFSLDIIHYNDFHARFEETSVKTSTCRSNNNSCLGGFPRLYYKINQLLKEKPDSLVLNAGDNYQGTYWYTKLKWHVMQEFLNLIPNDAHAIGNHEFDDGPEGLAPFLAALKAPVLVANMDVTKEPSLQGLFKPHIITERKGRKIGIIGLITPDTKELSSAGNVEFTDPKEATKREALILTEKGVDIIILLSHCGLEVDKEIARDHGEYVDIIIGGHSHSLLWNGPAPSGETVDGPYPVFIENTADKKHKVLIVQASAFTKYIGALKVSFDIFGNYVAWKGGPIFLNRSIPEDEGIKARLAPYAEEVHKAENIEVGESLMTLNFEDCVFGECALGNLLVDSLNLFGQKTKSKYHYLSFMQRGNIKSSILKGKITKGELFELLPFNDRVETYELQGKYILEALERSVIDAWDYNPFKGPWILQVSGLTVKYNISKPEGQRIVSVNTIKNNVTGDFDSNLYYQVTAPSFLSDGGDGYSMFKVNKRNVQYIGRDQSVIESYIQAHSPINVRTDNRIVIQN